MHKLVVIAILFSAGLWAGCRGTLSDRPPIHLNQNMDAQEKFDAQEANPFFADGRAARPPVPGTVARGFLQEDPIFYRGRTADGAYTTDLPFEITEAVIARGQERFNIYCAVCHGRAGDGEGIIMTGGYGFTPAPSFHIDRLREVQDGYLYDVITNGVRNMPAYAQQISVADRWATVAYVRALQLSQNATEADLTPSEVARLEQEATSNVEAGRQGQQ